MASIKKIQNLILLHWSIFYLLSCTVLWFCKLKTPLSVDIETNPGPAQKNQNKFSICHWNLNTAHGYAIGLLLKAYLTAHKMDIIYFSEPYPDSSIKSDNDNLEIPGYNLVCSNHPSNNKRSGVSTQYTTSLPLRVCFLFCLSISVFCRNS